MSKFTILPIIIMLGLPMTFTWCQEASALPNPCNIVVQAGPDITICSDNGKQLSGSVTGGFSEFEWSPPDGLSDPISLNPIANPKNTTTYTLTAKGVSSNLVVNGNFETGALAPSTSSYIQVFDAMALVNNSVNHFAILSVPALAMAFGCNPNIGNFALAIHGSPGPGLNCWCQTIPVTANTEYKIEYKVIGIPYIFGPAPNIVLKINNVTIGSVQAQSGLCTEAVGNFTWNSGSNTSMNMCLANATVGGVGNLCAIDDISVKACCEEKDEVTVTVIELEAEIKTPIEINCLNSPIDLTAIKPIQTNGITFLWTSIDGNIVGPNNTRTIKVDQPGTYHLLVKDNNGCESETQVIVTGNVTKPDLFTTVLHIDCKRNEGFIDVTSNPSSVDYRWTGPSGYFSNIKQNFVSEPGEYTITVTDDYFCSSTAVVIVEDKRTIPDLSVLGDTIRCGKDSAILTGQSLLRNIHFTWKKPNGITIDTHRITTFDTGWHYLTITDSLNCKNTDSFYVKKLGSTIPYSLFDDSLTCKKVSATIGIRIADTSAHIIWTGPGIMQQMTDSLIVNSSGTYLVQIEKDGCIQLDSVIVKSLDAIPDIQVNADTINCLKTSFSIYGNSNTANVSYRWKGPAGFDSQLQNPTVTLSGNYTLTITGPNGCETIKEIEVISDLNIPVVSFLYDTITCIDSIQIVRNNAQQQYMYNWSGPLGFSSLQEQPELNKAGIYTVTVTGANGCSTVQVIGMIEDKIIPDISTQSDTITCDSLQAQLFIDLTAFNGGIRWSGPNNFNSTLFENRVSTPGEYIIQATNRNGCHNTDTVNIIADVEQAMINLSADTIVCNKAAYIDVQVLNKPIRSVTWSGPKQFNSSQAKTTVIDSGWYTIQVVAENGCISMDSVFVHQKDILPKLQVQTDSITCKKVDAQLFATSNDPTVRYSWIGPSGFTSTIHNPIVKDSGTYTVTIIDQKGCMSTTSIYVTAYNTPVFFSVSGDSLNCLRSEIEIKSDTSDSALQYSWKGPNAFTSQLQKIKTNSAGWYVLEIENKFGCKAIDSILVEDFRATPYLILEDSSLTCDRTSIQLRPIQADSNLIYRWNGPGNFNSNNARPIIQTPGIYFLEVTNQHFCSDTFSVLIQIDTSSPRATIMFDSINCLNPTSTVITLPDSNNYLIKWTGPLNFSSADLSFSTNQGGLYILQLENTKNGCSNEITINIPADTNIIRMVEVLEMDESCDRQNGLIRILDIEGGRKPYIWSIDNGTTFNNQSFSNLAAGSYRLLVKDSLGCPFSLDITLEEVQGPQVSLPANITLNKSDQYVIQSTIQVQVPIDSIQWLPASGLSCYDCPSPTFIGESATEYTVTVWDENGCSSSATIRIDIIQNDNIYFPTVFSPNKDNQNDLFYPISGNSFRIKVNTFRIYDRWGEKIHEREDIALNDPNLAWNGTYKGKPLQPGVYVYYLECQIDGKNKIWSGNVSLLR